MAFFKRVAGLFNKIKNEFSLEHDESIDRDVNAGPLDLPALQNDDSKEDPFLIVEDVKNGRITYEDAQYTFNYLIENVEQDTYYEEVLQAKQELSLLLKHGEIGVDHINEKQILTGVLNGFLSQEQAEEELSLKLLDATCDLADLGVKSSEGGINLGEILQEEETSGKITKAVLAYAKIASTRAAVVQLPKSIEEVAKLESAHAQAQAFIMLTRQEARTTSFAIDGGLIGSKEDIYLPEDCRAAIGFIGRAVDNEKRLNTVPMSDSSAKKMPVDAAKLQDYGPTVNVSIPPYYYRRAMNVFTKFAGQQTTPQEFLAQPEGAMLAAIKTERQRVQQEHDVEQSLALEVPAHHVRGDVDVRGR